MVEPKRAVTNNPALVTSRISGVAQVENLGLHPALARDPVQPIDPDIPAGLLAPKIVPLLDNRPRCRGILGLCRSIGMIVTEVRADHDQRFGTAPDCLDDFLNFARG